jgi:hypothetical protein
LNAWELFCPGTIRTPVSRFQVRLRGSKPKHDLFGDIFFRVNLYIFELRCGFSKLFQRHTVDVPAPLATYIVVVPSALFKSFKSELDFLGLNGKAPITSVASDLHE